MMPDPLKWTHLPQGSAEQAEGANGSPLSDLNGTTAGATRLALALNWIVEDGRDPEWAAADWLATDIDPSYQSATEMLSDPKVSLDTLDRAKDAYKTMRIVGEAPADRRLGARLYLASIAAALARHHRRISRQSNEALERNLREMINDTAMPDSLRAVAGIALCEILQGDAPEGDHI